MPPNFNRRLWRLAETLQQAIAGPIASESAIELPDYHWRRSAELLPQIRRAHRHGWHLAAAQLEIELASLIPCVEQPLSALRQRLSQRSTQQHMFTVSTVYEDLRALEDEYGAIEFDLNERWLSVATLPVTLEGVYLGPFEIRLSWARDWRLDTPAYRVIALKPHPPECRASVTHPHVSDEALCEGEGRYAIRQALAQARLFDFFTLVTRVLHTYNSESPYVELALWRGATCCDCGALVEEDDSSSCEKCGATVCRECDRLCPDCDESFCYDCISTCPICNASVCEGCLTACETCRTRVCTNCLAENEECTKCQESHETEIRENNREIGTSIAGAAV